MLLADQYEYSRLIYGAHRDAHQKDQIHSEKGIRIPVDNTFPANDGSGWYQQSVQPYVTDLKTVD